MDKFFKALIQDMTIQLRIEETPFPFASMIALPIGDPKHTIHVPFSLN